MTDSILLFPAGYRVLDANGAPVSGAQVRFFVAGTSTPKTVYSDSGLSVSLGSIVYTRSDGYLVSTQGGNTTVAVYTGSALYKVDILDSVGVTIYPAKDNVKGAIDTSTFLTSSATSTLVIPVSAIATDTTLTTTHKGSLVHSSGNITLTLDAPATLTNGWSVKIRCNDSSNPTKIVASSGAIKGPGFSVAALALSGLGAEIELVCDGGNIIVANRMAGQPVENGRLWTVVSRVSSAPATTPGSWYLVSAAFGAFSTGDIIEATGQATFIGYTPPSNSGWLAYVQGENATYRHGTVWVQVSPAPLPTVQRLTSGSGTYTPPANVTRVRVRMSGSGGSGAAAATNNGNDGNDTTFNDWTAKKGLKGSTAGGAGGAGGSAGADGTGTKIVRIPGGQGQAGTSNSTGTTSPVGGHGGANPFGGAGVSGGGGADGGAGGSNTGAGGAGGSATGGNSGGGGGAGEYVEFWWNSPSAVSYSVGAAATGGAAGTHAGGNSGAGIIIVEEFYG